MTAESTKTRETCWWVKLVAFAVLITCFRFWVGPAPWETFAQAQIPNPGLQREKLVEEISLTNQHLQEIKHILKTKTFDVRLEGADNIPEAPPRKVKKHP